MGMIFLRRNLMLFILLMKTATELFINEEKTISLTITKTKTENDVYCNYYFDACSTRPVYC